MLNNGMKKIIGNIRESQKGFTLVELLVVIGIIVALAATIVPAVAQFAGSGESAAQQSEWDNVQTAIDTYMAENALTTVSDTGTGAVENVFTASGTLDLSSFLRETTTSYWYCWDSTGLVTGQAADTTGDGNADTDTAQSNGGTDGTNCV